MAYLSAEIDADLDRRIEEYRQSRGDFPRDSPTRSDVIRDALDEFLPPLEDDGAATEEVEA